MNTCRSCHNIANEDNAIRTGARTWMHRDCITLKYLDRKRAEIDNLRNRALSSAELGQASVAARLNSRADNALRVFERIINTIVVLTPPARGSTQRT
jgi:hypothetical protein